MRVRGQKCTRQRCARPLYDRGMCKTHLKDECDRLFGLMVRSRAKCESGRDKHKGVLQCAHGFSRRYLPTRWDEANAWSLCAGCHIYFTARPLEWDDWMLDQLGHEAYWLLRAEALRTDIKTDLIATYDRLVERAREQELV